METSPDRTSRSGTHARSGPMLRPRDGDATPGRHRAPVATSREGTRARTRPVRAGSVAAGAVGVAVLLAGGWALLPGGDGEPGSSGPASRPGATTAAPATGAAPSAPATDIPPSAAPSPPDRTVAAARAALEDQFAARADASTALLRATWAGDELAATDAARDVAAATGGVSDVVHVWRDAEVAADIRSGLDQQSAASRAYAASVASGDGPSADAARARMAEISQGLGVLLADLTSGRIARYVPPQDAAQYRAYVDALEAGDEAAADETARWLHARMVREGAALAAGLGEVAQ